MITASYILLMVVMGGRTILFVSQFDELATIDIGAGQTKVTALAVVFAIALILTVSGASWWRAHFRANDKAFKLATRVLVGGATLDGLFNVAEAYLLADGSGVLAGHPFPMNIVVWAAMLGIGIGPTLLTVGLASLAGMVDQKATTKRTSTRVNVAVERSVEVNDALNDHCNTIVRQLTTGETFKRSDVEQWTGLGKVQSVRVLNYGKEHGLFSDHKHGIYVYQDKEATSE